MRTKGKRQHSFETLERRELMAADISFNTKTGALAITGSGAGDTVQLNVITPSQMDVRVNNSYQRINPTKVRSITMDLGAGNDRVEVNGVDRTALNPKSIDINLGSGVREQVMLTLPSVARINVDARASRETSVMIRASVTDRAFVDMGDDAAGDTVWLLSSDIKRFEANMGGGDDLLLIQGTSVQKISVNMGDGNDKAITQGANAYVQEGTIEFGRGNDTIDPQFQKRGRNFERKWAW